MLRKLAIRHAQAQTFRITHPFHPRRGQTFQLVDCRQTWGEDRVYFYDTAGQLARLPLQWTDVGPDDPTVVVGAGGPISVTTISVG